MVKCLKDYVIEHVKMNTSMGYNFRTVQTRRHKANRQ